MIISKKRESLSINSLPKKNFSGLESNALQIVSWTYFFIFICHTTLFNQHNRVLVEPKEEMLPFIIHREFELDRVLVKSVQKMLIFINLVSPNMI